MFTEWGKEWQELWLDVQREGSLFDIGLIDAQSHQDTGRIGTWNGHFYHEIEADIGYNVTMDFDLVNLEAVEGNTTFPGQTSDKYNDGHRRE